MINMHDIFVLKNMWKNEAELCCLKYAACLIGIDGIIVTQEPKSLMAQSGTKVKEHMKRVKKALSGTAENNIIKRGIRNTAPFLEDLTEGLQEPQLMELYEHIAEEMKGRKNPIEVIVYNCAFDIPAKAKDGTDLEDSDRVYKHIIVLVCDTRMQKKELAVISAQEEITIPNRIIKQPITGFIYPVLENMEPVDNEIIIYNANPESPCHTLYEKMEVERFRTTEEIMSEFEDLFTEEYNDRKDQYLMAIMDILGNRYPYEVVGHISFKQLLEQAGIEGTDTIVNTYHDRIGKYNPSVNQLIIPKYAAMRAYGLRRERKKNLLLRAAAVIEESKGAEAELARELREEADR